MSKPILVTGSMRSGTSLTAGVLFYLGVFMGDWFLKRDKFTPLGYFENMDLADNDGERHEKKISKTQWKNNLVDTIKGTQESFEANKPLGFTRYGLKAPSIAEFPEDYFRITNPDMIWCKRKKEDNLESLKNMHWEETAEDLHKRKLENMERVKDKCYIIQLEDLLENTEFEVGKLAGYFGLKPTPRQIKRAIGFVLKKPDKTKAPELEHYQNYI